jgi:hypothetical protein
VIVTVSCLGNEGRFGNQLFQYAYARAYAESIGAELHTPDWIGRTLFKDINEPIMQALGDVDLVGYFQGQEHLSLLSRAKVKEWFTFKEPLEVPIHDLVFHKRRGDYLNCLSFWGIVSDKSYENAAKELGLNLESAVVLDDSNGDDLLLFDFFTMMKCKTLFRANSTFSWWAATLGNCRVYSPKVGNKVGWIDVPFVEGNESGTCRDVLELKISP